MITSERLSFGALTAAVREERFDGGDKAGHIHAMLTPAEHDAREAVLNARFQALSTAAAFVVTTMGTAVLVGWTLDVDLLERVAPGLRVMNPVSAIAFILCGFSLALLRESRLTSRRRLGAQLLGAAVFFIGTLELVETLTGAGPEFDHLLFRSRMWSSGPVGSSEMATASATAFMLFGLALVCFGGRTRLSHRLSQAASTVGTTVGLVPLIAYLYGVDMEPGFGSLVPMAAYSSLSFVMLGIGLLIAPDTQAIKLVSRADLGGRIVRRFFPTVVVTIVFLGYLSLAGQHAGWYETGMGLALMVAATIVALGGLLWWNAAVISQADQHRLAMEATLKLSESALRAANEALALQVRIDSLTGVANRMALGEELGRAMQTAHRYESEIFSVLMIDVDYFKRYNDSFGHLAGDEVLRGVARLLETTCRATDIVGRYGGEEFAIILPHAAEAGAREIAERLRAAVERQEWPNASITVSVGIATASAEAMDADEVLREADFALYLAKQGGRNRVCHAVDTPVEAQV
ncbi:MAG: diguanylate cyclase [Gemmatimonadaceae bacterium]